MEEVRGLLGGRRLSLIGQGLGGLVARYAAEQLGGMDFLDRLVMLGTPNQGTYSFLPWVLLPGARQTLPVSTLLKNLNSECLENHYTDVDSRYVNIYSPYDMAMIPWSCCRLEGALNLRVGWLCTHKGLLRSRALLGLIVRMLEGRGLEGEEPEASGEDAELRELNLSLKEDPQDETCLYRRGKLLLEQGYYGCAIRDLSALIKLRPDFAEAYMLRGKALRRKMNYDENPIYNPAIRDFNQVVRLKPGWAEAYYERGVCYALLNDWLDAVDNWDRSLILNRDLYPAYLARGLGRRKRGDITGAQKDFSEVLRIQPDEPEALRLLSEFG
jgi:tetratricopeptide (TPR) repeat protein